MGSLYSDPSSDQRPTITASASEEDSPTSTTSNQSTEPNHQATSSSSDTQSRNENEQAPDSVSSSDQSKESTENGGESDQSKESVDQSAQRQEQKENDAERSDQSEDYSEAIEMSADEQKQKEYLSKVEKFWEKYNLVAPKIAVKELKEAEDWSDWKYKMLTDLESYQLDSLCETDYLPAVKQTDQYKRFNKQAVRMIGLCLSPSIRNIALIGRDPDARKVWSSLVDQFEGKGTVQTIKCFSRITRLIAERNETGTAAVSIIREVKAKFDENASVDKEALWKAILVNSLPSTDEALQTILSTQPESKTLDELCELVVQSDQIKAIDDADLRVSNSALVNAVKSKKEISKRICYECGEQGHFKKQCELYKRRIRAAGRKSRELSESEEEEYQSASRNKFKRPQTNAIVQKQSKLDDEEVLDLNPKSFRPFIGSVVYRPEFVGDANEQNERSGANKLEEEVLDLNPASSDRSLTTGFGKPLTIGWLSGGRIIDRTDRLSDAMEPEYIEPNGENRNKRGDQEHMVRVQECAPNSKAGRSQPDAGGVQSVSASSRKQQAEQAADQVAEEPGAAEESGSRSKQGQEDAGQRSANPGERPAMATFSRSSEQTKCDSGGRQPEASKSPEELRSRSTTAALFERASKGGGEIVGERLSELNSPEDVRIRSGGRTASVSREMPNFETDQDVRSARRVANRSDFRRDPRVHADWSSSCQLAIIDRLVDGVMAPGDGSRTGLRPVSAKQFD